MSHPIYGPPDHKLGRVEFVLELPLRANKYQARVTAHGYSPTKRSALWTLTETFDVDTKLDTLAPIDLLHHLALVAVQDRPLCPADLHRSLRGGVEVEETLPLF